MSKIEPIEKEYDRLSKRQRVSYTLDCVNQLITQISKAQTSIQQDPEQTKTALSELKSSVKKSQPNEVFNKEQKELHAAINKLGKAIDKNLLEDISAACQPPFDFDRKLLNEIIAQDLFRQGRFNIGLGFLKEAEVELPPVEYEPFVEMYQVLEGIKQQDLTLALEWVARKRDFLPDGGNSFEFKLHSLQVLHLLSQKQVPEALSYARTHLQPFSPTHMHEIQRIMAAFLYVNRLPSSPYADLFSPSAWADVSQEYMRVCCSLLGLSHESALRISVTAGTAALPILLKLAQVVAGKPPELSKGAPEKMPVEIELGPDHKYHSIFSCPVSREVSSDENPPMLLPCGHVLCKQSIQKLGRGASSRFKCPYCPLEQTVSQSRRIFF
eukprot:TRINITY_DN945_c0_g1::TRINITY_DN945_c0_g1_i1::g.16097::m.16097 TRINITY_DN945_c0_g1::TRINITY_DN945_c0_g1_i1::g.16097  ORF type:complete len:395 (-),score=50.81,sp/Q80YQ8/RMD5A_MOUSE/36.42/8e-73,CLTH/PF10607.4/1.2e+03,CLTH/PF10607.4/1.2e-29,zf-RING_UBOX/PF13445.1/3.8e+03,zf-RING_UBOX/PF13445.1/1.6e-16,zf-RING_5/PF14634.1/2.7e-06,zf-C3HC4_2/PF13923.1/7.7e-05,zf-RING_2/PF13639.1/8.3e-05,zf-C3HC4/PF00097.20/0.00013,zf-C3HC4_3/PF13920.1/0.00011,zf-C3HC4_4/PF15227.1/4.6e+03,zf-C3HC4_4/PF15227.1/0.00013,